MGVSARYFSNELRPSLFMYRDRMMQRASVKRTILLAETIVDKHVTAGSDKSQTSYGKTVFKMVLVVGVIACGYVGYKQIMKRGWFKF